MHANVLDMFHGDNREKIPNFAALKANGFFALIHKCTQGTNYVDKTCQSRIAAARDAGLLVGFYHFGDNTSPNDQVDHFMQFAKPRKGDLLALDYETEPNGHTMGPIQAQNFILALFNLGFPPVLYGSDLPREHASIVTTLPKNRFPYLWLAEYGPHENIPKPWVPATVLLWQFSERGSVPGVNGHVDLNVFDGTFEQLSSKWGKPCNPALSFTPGATA
jgi:lysozyme